MAMPHMPHSLLKLISDTNQIIYARQFLIKGKTKPNKIFKVEIREMIKCLVSKAKWTHAQDF